MIKPEINGLYQHRYGGLYRVVDIVTSTVDKSKWVAYSHIYPFEVQTWIRPYDEWCDGRFTRITPAQCMDLEDRDRETFKAEINKARELATQPAEGTTSIIDGKVADYRNGKWVTVQG